METVILTLAKHVKAETWDEYASCLAEQTFHDYMRNAWELYVDLGHDREKLARQVIGELDHIPRSRGNV